MEDKEIEFLVNIASRPRFLSIYFLFKKHFPTEMMSNPIHFLLSQVFYLFKRRGKEKWN